MAYGGNFATQQQRTEGDWAGGFSAKYADIVHNKGKTPYEAQFGMWPKGPGSDSVFRTNLLSGKNKAYLGPGGMAKFKKDTAYLGSRGGAGRLLGEVAGNVAYRAGIRYINGVVVKTGGVTDAILYEQRSRPGTFGYRSPLTQRFRNQAQSKGWQWQLTQSTGPNKAPHGIAQSSIDITKEVYSTEETRFAHPGIYDTNEKWDPKTKRFERQWRGWKELKINNRWKHYSPVSNIMFGEKNPNVGAARRFKRTIL